MPRLGSKPMNTSNRRSSRFLFASISAGLLLGSINCANLRSLSTAPADEPAAEAVMEAPSTRPVQLTDSSAIGRIRDEGLNRSQVMKTMSYLTDVIGPRLTGSPNLKRANEWTRDQLKSWGLINAEVEPWGEFGRGWELKRFSAEVIEPQSIPLIGFPRAWSPGLVEPIEREVIYLNPRSVEELQSYAGKLEGKIILTGAVRAVRAQFAAPGVRYTDDALVQMSRGRAGRGAVRGGPTTAPATGPSELLVAEAGARRGGRRGGPGGNAPATAPAFNPAGQQNIAAQIFSFAVSEKAAVVVTSSTQGDGGTMFVQTAAVPSSGGRGGGPSIYSMQAPATVPQVMLAVEHFNRLVRMLEAGEKVKMAVNLQVQYFNDDLKAYNTVAEIPGTDLKDQIVMLGGHMDSWHSGTGATDNGAGVAVAMEAVRILKALNLHPRRTIRIALWTGEEQGLLGSREYVTKHFGAARGGGRGRGGGGDAFAPATLPAGRGRGNQPQINKQPEYDKFSAYFNLDNGTGKIRGVYAQNNPNVIPIFQEWLKPFHDLGATTISPGTTGSTDHVSFDNIGLPGFQFIQDQVEYNSRTHHSNMDVFDRIQEDDMKQAATIMAAFVYNAAMMDERLPKKAGF